MSSALRQTDHADRPNRAGRIGRVAAAVLLAAAVPAAVLLTGSTSYEQSRYGTPVAGPHADAAVAAATPPTHDPGKQTAVVVVGGRGANVADVLVPYDLLSSTGRFNVYVVAPQRRPLPLLGGLDVVPDLTFAELADRLGGAGPDVTVVPDMPTDAAADAAVAGWLRDTAGRGLVLGVCSGARLVADAGLLDGRPATSHWYRLGAIEAAHPQVNWQRGVRYIDDGSVITTAVCCRRSTEPSASSSDSPAPPPPHRPRKRRAGVTTCRAGQPPSPARACRPSTGRCTCSTPGFALQRRRPGS